MVKKFVYMGYFLIKDLFMIYDDKIFIGKIIKNARKKAGLNQSELAEMIDMCDKNIGNIENGKQFPQVNNFLHLIEVLELSLEDFGVKKYDKKLDKIKTNLIKMILSSDEKELRVLNRIIQAINDE